MRQIILALFILAANTTAISQEVTLPFASEQFQIAAPSTWRAVESKTAVIALTDPALPHAKWEIDIFRFTPGNEMTLEEFSQMQLKQFKATKKNADKLLSGRFEQYGAHRWWVVDFTTSKGSWYKCFQTIIENRRYSIYYIGKNDSSFELGLPKTVAFVESFKSLDGRSTIAGKTQEKPLTNPPSSKPAANQEITVVSNSKAGTVAPDAVKFEADKLEVFFGKYSRVVKGNTDALINDAVKFVFPYGKYKFMSPESQWLKNKIAHEVIKNTMTFYPPWYGSLALYHPSAKPVKVFGLFEPGAPFANGKGVGFVDPSGKVVMYDPRTIDHEGYFAENDFENRKKDLALGKMRSLRYDGSVIVGAGNAIQKPGAKEPTYINYRKESTDWPEDGSTGTGYTGWTCGLLPASSISYTEDGAKSEAERREIRNKKIGFINRKGEFQVKPAYYSVGEFSEGIAFVSWMDEFGKLIWGGIDTAGNLVIPFTYRVQPGRFSNGRSLITAVDMPTVAYAMINRKGDMVFTIPKNSGDTISVAPECCMNPLPEKFLYSHGYTFVNLGLKSKPKESIFLLDTNGVYTPIMQKLRAHFPAGETLYISSSVKDGQFLFSVASKAKNGMGIADVKGNILIPPVFNVLSLFEPESKLQYAEFGKKTSSDRGIEGYIDRTGVFRVVRVDAAGGF